KFDNVTENTVQVVSADPIRVTNVTVTGTVTATWIKATNLTVKANSALTQYVTPDQNNPKSLNLDVSGTLTLESGATIDVRGRGYPATKTYPNTSNGGSGNGSHMGRGVGVSQTGATYGSVYRPQEEGAGGNATSGGGVVRINAGSLVF